MLKLNYRVAIRKKIINRKINYNASCKEVSKVTKFLLLGRINVTTY